MEKIAFYFEKLAKLVEEHNLHTLDPTLLSILGISVIALLLMLICILRQSAQADYPTVARLQQVLGNGFYPEMSGKQLETTVSKLLLRMKKAEEHIMRVEEDMTVLAERMMAPPPQKRVVQPRPRTATLS